jgi:hypothetical protein
MITAVLLLALAQDPPSPADRERVAAAQQLTGEGTSTAAEPESLYTRGNNIRWGRYIGTLAAGVGVILLGIATGFFAGAHSLDHQRHQLCPGNPCTEAAAYDLYAKAGTDQNIGVLLSGIGGGLFGAGALLFFFKGDF